MLLRVLLLDRRRKEIVLGGTNLSYHGVCKNLILIEFSVLSMQAETS